MKIKLDGYNITEVEFSAVDDFPKIQFVELDFGEFRDRFDLEDPPNMTLSGRAVRYSKTTRGMKKRKLLQNLLLNVPCLGGPIRVTYTLTDSGGVVLGTVYDRYDKPIDLNEAGHAFSPTTFLTAVYVHITNEGEL